MSDAQLIVVPVSAGDLPPPPATAFTAEQPAEDTPGPARLPAVQQVTAGLASAVGFADALERFSPASFGPDTKGFIVVILGHLEREVKRVTVRLETFESRERELQSELATEQTRS